MKEADANQEHLKSLILSAKSGDNQAFEEVYTSYYTPVYRYILGRIKNRDEAEDMTQTVFIKIWTYIPNWNTSHTSPLSFFFTVARNTLIDHYRKNSHREIVSDEIVYGSMGSDTSADKLSDYGELKTTMVEAVSKLSEEQQEIVRLYYTNDLTYKEISEILGKREDAIRQMHSRAIKRLREIYKY
ncbi:MAG: sigma-70 family RNA polymerase sigma factor [Patescibacteria group bacterium]